MIGEVASETEYGLGDDFSTEPVRISGIESHGPDDRMTNSMGEVIGATVIRAPMRTLMKTFAFVSGNGGLGEKTRDSRYCSTERTTQINCEQTEQSDN